MNTKFEMGIWPKQFCYNELAQSTSDFAENNKLGEGGFGRVYKERRALARLRLHGKLKSRFAYVQGEELVDMKYKVQNCQRLGNNDVVSKGNQRINIFSFGVVALELVCGRKPVECKPQEEQIRLIEWVWELYGTDTLIEAADTHLGLDFVEEEIKHLMIVGLWCVHPHSEPQPSMRQVIQVLNSQASLPVLPTRVLKKM
ncbi:hypothetical protein E3N88_09048 [Mikania micrantha]|uniref:Protein kinase domain-containing protein n=1 Tax=Mikania micrantha TaxID=192012 RepID=A0A5N6PIK7_9ASTR|nr:hypothetical protein E3N88_09048 [Mikania micrantha]